MAATRGRRVAAILLLAWACSSTEEAIERFEVRRPTQNFELRRPTPQEAFSPDRKAVPWTNLGEGANEERLVSGFSPPDHPAWRWTEPKFQLYLDPIHDSRKSYLAIDFAVTKEHIDQAGEVTLKALVEGELVAASAFEKDGRREISVEVPRRLTDNKAHVAIEFQVDPPFKLNDSDLRGVVALGAGFRNYYSTSELRKRQVEQAKAAYTELVKQYPEKIPTAERNRLQLLFHDLDIWRSMWFQGVEVIKNPLDLWMAQQVIYELQPKYIVETGTFKGGSALYWAHTLRGMSLDDSRVLTVDIENLAADARTNPLWDEYVQFYLGSSTDERIVAEIAEQIRGKTTIVFLDSDHRAHHVKRELEMYAPLVSPGSYIVVEDTHIDALGTQPAIEAGPMAAIEEFLASDAGKDFERDLSREAFVLTFNPGGWLKRKSS